MISANPNMYQELKNTKSKQTKDYFEQKKVIASYGSIKENINANLYCLLSDLLWNKIFEILSKKAKLKKGELLKAVICICIKWIIITYIHTSSVAKMSYILAFLWERKWDLLDRQKGRWSCENCLSVAKRMKWQITLNWIQK